MQVTFGEEGSGFSKPRRFPPPATGNMGDWWPPLRLPLDLRRRLREAEREAGVSRARPGLVEGIFIEEEEGREVKQMKREVVVVVVVRWGLVSDESIILFLVRPLTTKEWGCDIFKWGQRERERE